MFHHFTNVLIHHTNLIGEHILSTFKVETANGEHFDNGLLYKIYFEQEACCSTTYPSPGCTGTVW